MRGMGYTEARDVSSAVALYSVGVREPWHAAAAKSVPQRWHCGAWEVDAVGERGF